MSLCDELDGLVADIESKLYESAAQPVPAPAAAGATKLQNDAICKATSYRTHSCNALRASDEGKTVTLSGWVQKSRDKKAMAFVDLRDRFGITQCIVESSKNKEVYEIARKLGRETVVQVTGVVKSRGTDANKNRATGGVEIEISDLKVLNEAKNPKFKIQDKTDGKEDIRMQYRYLDIRRNPVKNALILRNQITIYVREFLASQDFVEIETPILIKSTPEGARDFVVPSRVNAGQFYALPQSPQTFKQILMVAGMDRYFQIARCFRDEELRADRQPEFTQIDCEMSFVSQADVLNCFEGMIKHLFKKILNVDLPPMKHQTWDEAIEVYGSDKPDLRFDMKLQRITDIVKGHGLKPFDESERVVSLCIEGACSKGGIYDSKKKLKKLEKLAKSELIGSAGIVYCKVNKGGKLDSPAKKFLNQDVLGAWAKAFNAKEGDLLIAMWGEGYEINERLGSLRAELGNIMGLRDPSKGYSAHWVVDFPMFEYKEDDKGNKFLHSMHHPFTAPKPDHLQYLKSDPLKVRANAYDMVINGVEVGGGSIRIHDKQLQSDVFQLLGFTKEQAQEQFGFLMNAFEYGPPPHGGLAFGLARLSQLIGGALGLDYNSIRDYIAFPKNNQGRDVMINAPSQIAKEQLDELSIAITCKDKKKEP